MITQFSNLVRFVSVLAPLGKTTRRLTSGVVLAAAVFTASLQAQIVYDATADFSITNENPNGAWSYGWMPTDFSQFNLDTVCENRSHGPVWVRVSGGWPGIWKNTTGSTAWGVPPGFISIDPGLGEEPSILRWTSPLRGFAHIQGRFLAGDSGTMLVAVRLGGQAVWQAVDSGEFDLLESIVPGDTVDFVVYGGYYGGVTPLEAIISLTPVGGGAILLRRNSLTVHEADCTLLLEVLRFGPEHLNEEVTVDFATVDGTAHAGADYVAASGTLHFAAGETNKQIAITILDDALEEREEQFRLVLSNPTGGVSLGNSNVVIRIQDNELLFYDDFESYPTGSFPGNGWGLVYEGAGADVQQVGAPPGGRTGKALHLNGVPYWCARAYRAVEFPPSFAMECLLYSAEGAGFSGYNPTLGAWGDHYAGVVLWGGQIQARLRVYGDLGEINELWVPLMPYRTNTWYRVRSVVDLASRSFDIYVDGQLVGQGLPILAPGLPLGVEVSSGASFWVDEVKVVSTVPQSPLSLQLKSTWRLTTTNSVHVVEAVGTSALVGTDNGITHRLDTTDPAKPVLSGTWDSLVTPSSLCLRSNFAFIAGWELDFLSTVELVDFTDPAHPVLRDFFDTPGYVQGIAVTDRNAFVADDEVGLIILDISDPAALREVGHYPTRGPLKRIAVSGTLAYLGLEGGLIILDITDPAKPIRVGVWSTSNPVRDLVVQGTTVFVLEAGKGLEILDVRQPGNPVLVGSHAWVMDAVALDVQGDYVFLANGARGLQVIDVSNAAKPQWVAGYATSGPAKDVAVSGNRVWVAAGAQGLLGFEFLDRRIKVEQPAGPGNGLTFSWQADSGWQLQRTTNLLEANWQAVPTSETTNRITVPTGVGSGFFRLVKP